VDRRSLAPDARPSRITILGNIRQKSRPRTVPRVGQDPTESSGRRFFRSRFPKQLPARKITLRKGPETAVAAHPSSHDSIAEFGQALKAMDAMFEAASRDRAHLMSVLGDALNSAVLQKNRQALLLSALIIYYLKQNGYMVEPFVKRLKEAERRTERRASMLDFMKGLFAGSQSFMTNSISRPPRF
jgi:hypothetical protein